MRSQLESVDLPVDPGFEPSCGSAEGDQGMEPTLVPLRVEVLESTQPVVDNYVEVAYEYAGRWGKVSPFFRREGESGKHRGPRRVVAPRSGCTGLAEVAPQTPPETRDPGAKKWCPCRESNTGLLGHNELY